MSQNFHYSYCMYCMYFKAARVLKYHLTFFLIAIPTFLYHINRKGKSFPSHSKVVLYTIGMCGAFDVDLNLTV